MASFDFCIDQAFKSGKITKDVAERIKTAEDPETAINSIVGDLTRQKREAAIQAIRLADAWDNIQSYAAKVGDRSGILKSIFGDANKEYGGLIALLTKDVSGRAGYENVEKLGAFYENKFQSQMADALSRFRTRSIGFEQDQEGLKMLAKAIYGETVEDAEIMRFADDWRKVTENIRQEFNAKGGSISKNEKWLLPQNHDAKSIEKMGLDAWKSRIGPLLDRTQMLDDSGKALDDKSFSEGLDFTYETITSGGLNKAKDFTVPMLGKKLSRKGSERRFLYFKDADSWLQYQKEYGKGDIFTTLTDHIEMKANDIALMEVLGTSPESTFKALQAQIEKGNKLSQRQKFMAQAQYNVVSGKVNQGEMTTAADVMQSTRNVMTAGLLGNAFLSATTDAGFSALTSRYNGIQAVKVFARQAAQLDPTNEADRIFAVKMGLGAEAWLGRAHGSNRYSDIYGTGATAKAAEGVMRASLLAPWTDAGRKAFGMEYGAMLAENFGKSVAELDAPVQRAFESYGIDSNLWDTFRKSKPLEFKGAKFADMTQDGGKKFHQMVMSETDFAVPTPDAKVRAITTGGLGRGTIEGQAWRSVMMLKSFPITVATTHFYRAAYQATTADKVAYAGLFALTTTIMGGMALQMKDVASGREPRPMDNPKFLAAAFQQGGGLGIFGDFLFSDVNRFGGGITQTIIGPTGQLVDTGFKFTIGNLHQAVKGEEMNVLGEAAQIFKRYSPDVWQTRLFTDSIIDQAEMMANPDAQRRFNRIARKRQKEFNQGYWWKPGESKPEFSQ
ncbi:MAG: hypothetical protein ACW99G_16000 [Candidatus Thorarchaeota archaeon]|jgi:hypothetical protein